MSGSAAQGLLQLRHRRQLTRLLEKFHPRRQLPGLVLHFLFRGQALEHLFGRIDITGFRLQLRQVDQHLHVFRVLPVQLRQQVHGPLKVTGLPQAVRGVVRVLRRGFHVLLQHFADFTFRQGTVEAVHRLPVLDQNHGRQAANPQARGQLPAAGRH